MSKTTPLRASAGAIGALLLFLSVLGGAAPAAAQSGSDPQNEVQTTTTRLYLPVVQRAVPVVPNAALSYYIQDASPSALWALGCGAGQYDQATSGKQDHLVVLNFGQMWIENGVYGAGKFYPKWGFVSLSDVENAVKSYIQGYYNCTGSDNDSQMMVAIGTNNYGSMNTGTTNQSSRRNSMYTFGQKWADMVNNIYTWAAGQGYTSQVSVAGAIDIEWGGDDYDITPTWNTAYITRGWVDGFKANSRNVHIFFNFGACSGCNSTYSTSTTPNWAYRDEWTISDVWYVSWGASPAYAVPEIYLNSGVNAKQWQTLSEYAARIKGLKIDFSGPMTQYQACIQRNGDPTCPQMDNTPSQGWQQLYDALNASSYTTQSVLRWVTDIAWQIK